MSFCTLNGRALLVAKDSWFEVPRRGGEINTPTMAGAFVSVELQDARAWECSLTPVAASAWPSLRSWIEGQGQAWSFADGRSFSTTGVLGEESGGVVSYLTTGGRLTRTGLEGCMSLASGAHWGVRMANKMGTIASWVPARHGFTFFFWVYLDATIDGNATSGWHFCAITGNATWTRGTANPSGVTQYRSDPASPATAPAAGSHSLGNICQVATASAPWCALSGYQLDGGGATAKLFQDVGFVPYQMTAAEVAAIYNLTREGGNYADGLSLASLWPFVVVDGDCVDSVPTLARVRVTRAPLINGNLGAGHANNLRVPQLRLDEFIPTTAADPFAEAPPTIEDLILGDPDLFLYYPLTDATNPGVVADLGPHGLDLTVYDSAGNGSHLFGQVGPTPEIPSTLVLERAYLGPDGNDTLTNNQMGRASTGNPNRPTGALTFSWIGYCESDANYPIGGYYSRSFVFQWGTGEFDIALSDNQGGVNIVYGSLSVTLNPGTIYSSTARHFLATFDPTLGVAGTWLLYVNGALAASEALPYAKTGPAAGAERILIGASSPLTGAPPVEVNWNYWWNGGLCHVFASTRTYAAADALALAQAAGFA